MANIATALNSRWSIFFFTILVSLMFMVVTFENNSSVLLNYPVTTSSNKSGCSSQNKLKGSYPNKPINFIIHQARFPRPSDWYSQKQQDEWVYEVLQIRDEDALTARRDHFYLDLAANAPSFLSNTYAFDQVGWGGICIDGNHDLVTELVKKRSCTVIEAVVDRCDGRTVTWSNGDDKANDALGGIVGEEYDNQKNDESNTETHITTTLEQILDHVKAPKIIDYFSLDVEGAEFAVLQNFPFDRYMFRAITIERPPPWLNDLLLSSGYVWIQNYKFDSFYLHKTETAAVESHGSLQQIPRKCVGKDQRLGRMCEWGDPPKTEPCPRHNSLE